MDKRNIEELEARREEALRGENQKPLRKDLFAWRGRFYDKIKIPLKTLDIIIYVLVGALVVALLLGIGSNR